MNIDLIRSFSRWEHKRVERNILESKYAQFTGSINVCELHIPYTHWDKVDCMVTAAKSIKGKKMLFLAGDSLNLDLFSRFYQRSSDKSKPSNEISTLIEFLKYAERVYDKIVFMISNHENRLTKVIAQYVMHKEIGEEILNLMQGYDDIFEKNKLKNIEIVDDYIFQIGNVLITHLENNSSVPGNIDRSLVQYLVPRIERHWDIVFQAHTHSQSRIPIDRKLCIETGCLTDSLDYWVNGKMQGKGKHSTLGYGVCHMVNGVADMNWCDFIVTGWQGWI